MSFIVKNVGRVLPWPCPFQNMKRENSDVPSVKAPELNSR